MSIRPGTLAVITGGVFPEHIRKVVTIGRRSEIWADCWHTRPVLMFYGEEIVWKESHLTPLVGVESIAAERVAEVA